MQRVKIKKIPLNFSAKASAAVSEMAAATLKAGGFDPEIGEPNPPEAGDKMPDATIFAGVSPDTGKPMYTTPADAPLTMTFNDASDYAKKLDAHGHQDWRVPNQDELDVLFNNRAAIGGFDVSGSDPAGWSDPARRTTVGVRTPSGSATEFSTSTLRTAACLSAVCGSGCPEMNHLIIQLFPDRA
jgi:hypothetical protein